MNQPGTPADNRGATHAPRISGILILAVFTAVLAAQLWLVALAGTDIPFQDQWEVEGRGLYPALTDGSLRFTDLFRSHNEHRIAWTQALNSILFSVDGQWDPLVQLVVGAGLHAMLAAVLAATLTHGLNGAARWLMAGFIALLSVPLAAWHNALWGFQSQVYFVLLLSLGAFATLAPANNPPWRLAGGCLLTIAAMLAMGPGLLIPFVLAGALGWRALRNGWHGSPAWAMGPLAITAWLLRVDVPAHLALHAHSAAEFSEVFLRLLAWPYSEQSWILLILNLPFVLFWVRRLWLRRPAPEGAAFVGLAAAWIIATLAVTAWSRGGSPEFAAGVPSRYVDFVVLLPLANLWCLLALIRQVPRWRILGYGWILFLTAGWVGAILPPWRHILLPRIRDRDAPVRLIQAYQRTGDAAVFTGQPRLLVPHPDVATVQAVLRDPRLQGHLPPSLQPDRPMGPLSRATRSLLGR